MDLEIAAHSFCFATNTQIHGDESWFQLTRWVKS